MGKIVYARVVGEQRKDLLTIEQVSEELHIPVSTLRRHASQGKLSGKKIGNVWVFTREDIHQYEDTFVDRPNKAHTIKEIAPVLKSAIEEITRFHLIFDEDFQMCPLVNQLQEILDRAGMGQEQ